MILFYVRHGGPIYNPDSLTPLGKRQAESVAHRLALYGVDKIFSSTSIRAMETAQPTCEILKKELTTLEFCHEHTAWTQLAVTIDGKMDWIFSQPKLGSLMASPSVRALDREWYEHPEFKKFDVPLKEGMERIDRESDKFLASLGYVHDRENHVYHAEKPTDERVALFAHQGFGLAFLSSILDMAYPAFSQHFDMSHTGMTAIEFQDKGDCFIPRILTMANDSHLYRDGLPTLYNHRIRF